MKSSTPLATSFCSNQKYSKDCDWLARLPFQVEPVRKNILKVCKNVVFRKFKRGRFGIWFRKFGSLYSNLWFGLSHCNVLHPAFVISLYTEDPANGSQVDGVVQARNTRGVTISTVCRIFVPPLILSKEDTDNFTEEISELFDLNMPTEILGG